MLEGLEQIPQQAAEVVGLRCICSPPLLPGVCSIAWLMVWLVGFL
jgi:hypothetical protein